MPNKTKTVESVTGINFTEVAQHAGMTLMAIAATMGMIDLPNHPESRIIIPNQPAFAVAPTGQENNPLRREREETAPHHISYSAIQRTPGRTGKQ